MEAPGISSPSLTPRLPSIDVFRALTMLLMIFVNDLWTLHDIPAWLEHASADEDRMGLADIVFPMFVFIVGLSVPLGIAARRKAGDSELRVTAHILLRATALIIMGVFHVNLESYSEAALVPRPVFQIIITICFFLIWLDYRHVKTSLKYFGQSIGIVGLITMAALYKGGSPDAPEWMRFHWWGILGLIGWTYLVVALLFQFFKENIIACVALLVFFLAFNSLDTLDALTSLRPLHHYVWIIGSGSLPALAVAGIITTLTYQKLSDNYRRWWLVCAGFALVMFLFGFLTRPVWGIHKISASPSWVAICTGLSLTVFGVLTWWVDLRGNKNQFALIKPAGTSTITSYLLPYIHYALYTLVGISLPLILRTGFIGIIKCLCYSLVIILITGFLEKRNIRLKL